MRRRVVLIVTYVKAKISTRLMGIKKQQNALNSAGVFYGDIFTYIHILAVLDTHYTNECTEYKKVKRSRYRLRVAQRNGRGIALLFHDRGTRRRWVVNSTPRPHFTPGKDTVPILQETGRGPGPVWTDGKSRHHRDSIPDRPSRSQSLYRLRYPAHNARNIELSRLYITSRKSQTLHNGMLAHQIRHVFCPGSERTTVGVQIL